MGIRVQCDWCRETIKAGEPYMTVAIDGRIGQRDLGEAARVYCGSGDQEGGGRCGERVLSALDGNPADGPVDMGLEWRLVPVDATILESQSASPDEVVPVAASADLVAFLKTLAPSPRTKLRWALRQAGISELEQIAEMSDDEFVAMKECGWVLCRKVRKFIAARDAARTQGGVARNESSPSDREPIWRDDMAAYPRLELISAGLSFPSTRTKGSFYKALREMGIETIGDLRLAVQDDRLLQIGGIGPATLTAIRRMLEHFAVAEEVLV